MFIVFTTSRKEMTLSQWKCTTLVYVDRTDSMSMLTLFESRYTVNNQPVEASVHWVICEKLRSS